MHDHHARDRQDQEPASIVSFLPPARHRHPTQKVHIPFPSYLDREREQRSIPDKASSLENDKTIPADPISRRHTNDEIMKVTKQDMRWMNEPEKWKQKDDEIKMTCPMEVSFFLCHCCESFNDVYVYSPMKFSSNFRSTTGEIRFMVSSRTTLRSIGCM